MLIPSLGWVVLAYEELACYFIDYLITAVMKKNLVFNIIADNINMNILFLILLQYFQGQAALAKTPSSNEDLLSKQNAELVKKVKELTQKLEDKNPLQCMLDSTDNQHNKYLNLMGDPPDDQYSKYLNLMSEPKERIDASMMNDKSKIGARYEIIAVSGVIQKTDGQLEEVKLAKLPEFPATQEEGKVLINNHNIVDKRYLWMSKDGSEILTTIYDDYPDFKPRKGICGIFGNNFTDPAGYVVKANFLLKNLETGVIEKITLESPIAEDKNAIQEKMVVARDYT